MLSWSSLSFHVEKTSIGIMLDVNIKKTICIILMFLINTFGLQPDRPMINIPLIPCPAD